MTEFLHGANTTTGKLLDLNSQRRCSGTSLPVGSSADQENLPYWPLQVEMATDDDNLANFASKNLTNLQPLKRQRRMFPCAYCNEEFGTNQRLQTHITALHSSDGQWFDSKTIKMPSKVARDDEKRIYTCRLCSSAFKRSEHLKRHEQSHSELKPYHCERCGNSFKRNEHLKRHMISHYEVKPFSCATCGKQFSRKEHLKRHAQGHCRTENLESTGRIT